VTTGGQSTLPSASYSLKILTALQKVLRYVKAYMCK